MRRRRVLVAAALAATQALGRAHGGAVPPARTALLAEGEQALARGDAAGAIAAFERAAAAEHAPDIELGIVRGQMQGGDYRRALAFASHVAGAHREAAEGAAYYAWLLHLGGQGEQARRVLEQARTRGAPPALLEAMAERLADPAAPTPWLGSLRLAPYAPGATLPAAARLCATALLLDERHALAPLEPLAALRPGDALWLRDGLGRGTVASLLRGDAPSGLAVLRLARPLDAEAAVEPPPLAARDAFPGSPAYALGYAGTAAEPAWPRLQPGFVGGVEAGVQRLGVRLAPAAHRGPLFDAAGRLAGFALQAPDGDLLLGPAVLRGCCGEWLAAAPAGPAARLPVDALYERGMRWALQLIAAPA